MGIAEELLGEDMFESTTFGKFTDILHRSMDANAYRRMVISDNIANADTPEFKRSVVNFETMLGYALSTERSPRFRAALTSERHIPFHRPLDYRGVRPRRILDFANSTKNNGNNVDIEQESVLAMQNQLSYELMVQATSNSFNRINLVIGSGG